MPKHVGAGQSAPGGLAKEMYAQCCGSFSHTRGISTLTSKLFRVKKRVGLDNAPSTPLRGEDEYSHMLMVLGLTQHGFDRT